MTQDFPSAWIILFGSAAAGRLAAGSDLNLRR